MELLSRRKYLKYGFLTTAIFVMGKVDLFAIVTPLDTIKVVQEDLFPYSKELGIDTSKYIPIILNHSKVTKEYKDFITNGVKWLNEESVKKYNKIYTKLTSQKRQNLLKIISQQRWGENWIFDMLGYIFESMLGDPIYGGNNNEAGWRWLNFEGGKPRTKKAFL